MESRTGGSRRIACKFCRDRKVRCDGGQPSCEKCRRMGEECVYHPTYRPAKADLSQMVETLQQRLERAEAQLKVFEETGRGRSYSPDFSAASMAMFPNVPSSFPTPDESSFSSTQFNLMGSVWQSPADSPSPRTPENDPNYVPMSAWPTNGADNMGYFQFNKDPTLMESPMDTATLMSIQEPGDATMSPVNGIPPSAFHQQRPIPPQFHPRTMPTVDDNGVATAELTSLLTDVLTRQAEIAGISLVVADYLAWLRTAPKGSGEEEILQTLEARMREINQMAGVNTRLTSSAAEHPTQVSDFGNGMVKPVHMSNLEDMVGRQTADLEQFFKETYNVCVALTDQRRPSTAASSRSSSRMPVAGAHQQSPVNNAPTPTAGNYMERYPQPNRMGNRMS